MQYDLQALLLFSIKGFLSIGFDHSGQFGTQRTVNVPCTKEKVGSQVVQKTGIQCFNCKEYGHFAKECIKLKRVKDSAYHKEKMLLFDEQELEAYYSYMAKIQEVPNADSGTDFEPVEPVQNDNGYNVFANRLQHSEQCESVSNTCLVETDDSNVTPDSPDMCEDDIQNEQTDVESDDERVVLANLKLDVDENKMIQKQLKKPNTTLAQELKKCKAILAETSKSLGQSQEMHDDLKYVESLKKEIDALESKKAEFSDMYDVILHDCVSKDVMYSYLRSLSDLDALAELQCMYLHKVKECDCLVQKLSKQTESVKQAKINTVCNEKSLNDVRKEREQYFKIQDLKAQMQDKNIAISELKKLIEKGKGKPVDTKFDRPSVVRQPNAQQIPKPSVLGKPTPFSDSLERRYFPKTRSVSKTNVSGGLSKPVTTQTFPQTAKKAVSNTNVLKPGMYRINNRIAHTRAPQLPQTIRNTNLHVYTSTGVNHKPTVSRP
nr:hypothetical protein [Tanacetum cinerariifolium]